MKKLFIRLIRDLKKYREYLVFHSLIQLRTKVAGSYLGVLWLIIEPLAFMLIYSFVVISIMGAKYPNFHLNVFIGLIFWKFFSSSILLGTTSIVRNKSILDQVNFRKFVFPTMNVLVNFYELLIGLVVFLVLALFSGVAFTWHIIEVVPVLLVLFILSWGLSLIVSHFGVYLFDLRNIMDIVLRLLFYLSPVMWLTSTTALQRIVLLKYNPMSIIMTGGRDALLDGRSPDYLVLFVLLVISVVILFIGYNLIHKNESTYTRII